MAANKDQQTILHLEKEINSLSEEILNNYQEVNLLYTVSEKLGVVTAPEEIAQLALEEVLQQIPVRRASVMLFDENKGELKVLASIGLPPELGEHPTVSLGASMVEEVAMTGTPLLINDLREHPRFAARFKNKGYESFTLLSVPLLVAPSKVEQGVLGTINLSDRLDKPGNFTSRDLKLLSAIASQVGIALKRAYLFEDLKHSQQETEEAFFYTVGALARAAETHDEDTGNHILRVGRYAQVVAEELGLAGEFRRQIYYFAQMHDVGKIHIDPAILRKPGKLTEEEWAIMKSHSHAGALVIGEAPRLTMAREIALTHHERWDGTGYPQGLKGEEIPLAGRIAMLADIYDALRSARPYKPPFDHEKTYAVIVQGNGRTVPGNFHPNILTAFQKIHHKFRDICAELHD